MVILMQNLRKFLLTWNTLTRYPFIQMASSLAPLPWPAQLSIWSSWLACVQHHRRQNTPDASLIHYVKAAEKEPVTGNVSWLRRWINRRTLVRVSTRFQQFPKIQKKILENCYWTFPILSIINSHIILLLYISRTAITLFVRT